MSRFVRRYPKRCWLYARNVDPSTGRVRCTYCDRTVHVRRSLRWPDPQGRQATLDHVVPGAGHGADNLVTACQRCNRDKGCRTPRRWAAVGGPWDAPNRAARVLHGVPAYPALSRLLERYGLRYGPRSWCNVARPACAGGRGAGTAGRSPRSGLA